MLKPTHRKHRLPRWLAAGMLASFFAGETVDAQNVESELASIESRANQLQAEPLRREKMQSSTHVEERLTDGELFFQLKDYTRAAIVFSDIVSNYSQHSAYPNAVYLLGESLFQSRNFYGARNHFDQVLSGSAQNAAFRPYVQPALGRLIEIAIHTEDFRNVEEYFVRLNQLPPSELSGVTTYQRAKYLFNRAVAVEEVLRDNPRTLAGETEDPGKATQEALRASIDLAQLAEARRLFLSVPRGGEHWLRSLYFVATTFVLEGKFPEAIESFTQAVAAPATDTNALDIVELAHLGLGRLHYELDQSDKAIAAYQSIPRTSKFFERALFEIAWVHIRTGDSTRAERALEVLNVVNPDSIYIADGQLLRANLLLRDGRYPPAEKIFREVRNRFGPTLRQLDDTLANADDPQAYFRGVVRENLEYFDSDAFLPETARRYARQSGAKMERAMQAVSDLNAARGLVTETDEIAGKLDVVLRSPNRVHAHADLRRQSQMVTALRNRLAILRGRTLDTIGSGAGDARRSRERLDPLIRRLPTELEDFDMRDGRGAAQYKTMARSLRNLEIEVQGMQARVVAARRFLAQANQRGDEIGTSKSTLEEIANHERAIDGYKGQLTELTRLLGFAKLQVGIGDEGYARDRKLVSDYVAFTNEEQSSQSDSRLASTFSRISRLEAQLDTRDGQILAVLDERSGGIQGALREETSNLSRYRADLTALENEAEEVIGAITHHNFRQVRRRFFNLVLRADVGRVDVSWARREEHRVRVDALTRERSEEIQAIDDEFQEIMDMSSGSDGGEQ